jgi:ubiquitin carboxyl-terminal hydrolase L3
VYGLDAELLGMVPQPALAALLLFPITEATEALRAEEAAAEGNGGGAAAAAEAAGVFYMRQTIGNACGTIGLLHALGNAAAPAGGPLPLAPGSFLEAFLAATAGMSPAARGAHLEAPPPGAPEIDGIHDAAARQGATDAPDAATDTNLHFIAFVQRGGRLWELDGRKAAPVDHGPSGPATLLADTAGVVRRRFVERGGGSVEFSLIALAKAE